MSKRVTTLFMDALQSRVDDILDTCTKCGKCVMSCPTGALFNRGATVGEMEHDRTKLEFIVTAREKKQWIP